MKILKNFLITVVVNGLLLYILSKYVPETGLTIISEYNNDLIIFGFLGLVFWIANGVIKKILNIATLPIRLLTMGLSSLILNIIIFYIFEQLINYMELGIQVQLGNIVQVVILSVIMTALFFLIKKII